MQPTSSSNPTAALGRVPPGYSQAPLSSLELLETAEVDLYVQYGDQSQPALFCQARWPLERKRLAELREVGVAHLLLRNDDYNAFSNQLFQHVDAVLHLESLSTSEKFATVQTAIASEVEHSLRAVDNSAFCSLAEQVSHDIVQLLSDDELLPSDMFDLARHDYTTFVHVTNVAGYCVMLARRLELGDEQTLHDIAYGAMLHDIGKRSIPPAVLAKPGRLTPQERELIERHPTLGYRELCQRTDLSFGQLMMVYQHHEWMDGRGYPVGVLGMEIHPWARLLAIADVFDAITARRPYRQPLSIHEALSHQEKLAGSHFDEGMLQCWISMMTQS
jgi:HD-GYP domain-containing protein (c-di-GMP phosphodiesterase class II)